MSTTNTNERGQDRVEKLEQSLRVTLLALIQAVEAGDPFTVGHTQRVRRYAEVVAKRLGGDAGLPSRARRVAEYHSLCRLEAFAKGCDDRAETDDDPSDEEAGAAIGLGSLELIPELDECLPALWALASRAGSRPSKPSEEGAAEIPLEARIVEVCHAFDELTSQRPFAPALDYDQAIRELRSLAGDPYDPEVVRVMGEVVKDSSVNVTQQ